jgi:HK97 family phage major capsid protein
MDNEINTRLDNLVAEAQAVDAELAALDEPHPHPMAGHTRKIRFDTNERVENGVVVNSGNAFTGKLTDKFVKKHTLDEYNLEELALCRQILAARGSEMPDAFEDKFQSLADRARRLTMTTDVSGGGQELIDTVMYPRLFQDIVSGSLVAGLFEPWLNMPSQSVELPSLGNVTFYKPAGEGQAVTATDLATAKRTIKAFTLKAQTDVSDEESEDAIIALIPEIRTILVRNAKEVIDSVLLNGDTTTGATNINKYGSAVNGNEAYLLGFDGLIHYALIEMSSYCVSNVGAALDASKIRAILGLMGKYADDPSRVAFVTDRWDKNVLLGLTELQTMDKVGNQATILTGQIGNLYGSPVIVSDALVKSAAAGYVDGATPGNNTKGRILAINRDMWRFGLRRNIRVAVERSEAKTMTSIVVSMRLGLQCYGDRSSGDYIHTILGYNTTI